MYKNKYFHYQKIKLIKTLSLMKISNYLELQKIQQEDAMHK